MVSLKVFFEINPLRGVDKREKKGVLENFLCKFFDNNIIKYFLK